MAGGVVGRSARLKRPGTACRRLTQVVDVAGDWMRMRSIIVGNACPGSDGEGSACERTCRARPLSVGALMLDTGMGI